MTAAHEGIPAAVQQDLDGARAELEATLAGRGDEDLARVRRGGWSVRRVLQHLIQSEWHYVHLVCSLREQQPRPIPDLTEGPATMGEARAALRAARQALRDSLERTDEETFFRLVTVGREEYSVLSVLENVAHHDREHAAQIRSIIAAVSD